MSNEAFWGCLSLGSFSSSYIIEFSNRMELYSVELKIQTGHKTSCSIVCCSGGSKLAALNLSDLAGLLHDTGNGRPRYDCRGTVGSSDCNSESNLEGQRNQYYPNA